MKGPIGTSIFALLLALAAGASNAQTAATTITLEVRGGEHEGTYSATSQEPTCTYGYASEGMWGNQYSLTTARPDEFSSLQLIVDADDASDGTDYFLTTVSFGELFTEEETTYHFRTGSQEGRGNVTLEDRGSDATVLISAVTDDGVRIEATILCHVVLRIGSSKRGEPEPTAAGPVELQLGDRIFEFVAGYEEAYCQEAIAEDDDFQYGYGAEDQTAAEVRDIEVYLPSKSRSSEFYLSLHVGHDWHSVDTLDGNREGSGSVKISGKGARREITVDAVTAEGVRVSLRAECSTE